ncbi:hypothetical protein [Chitinophaga sp. MM2321]|uniref:hypothetical protein n=1 Tax=Chitinophaga sp. MM2321 TaxID=3137178 RepID=UPI0032D5A946
MKRNQFRTMSSLLAAALLSLSSCIKPGPIIIPPAAHLARITQLKGDSYYWSDSIAVNYNTKGYPVSLVPSVIATGTPQTLLMYDKQNRLIANIGAYRIEELGFEMAYKYLYDDHKNRITRDTCYVFGRYSSTSTPIIQIGQAIRSTSYTYDDKNRIIKTVEKSLERGYGVVITKTYSYNAAGNAWKIHTTWEYPTDTTYNASSDLYPQYDDKVNFHNLHAIWQFLDKDYSINNAFNATSYDLYGLPTAFDTNSDKDFMNTLGFPLLHTEIKYKYLP